MKNYKLLPLIIVSLFFLISPLISNAQWISTGQPCQPDIVKKSKFQRGDPGWLEYIEVFCPFDKNGVGDKLNIRWDLGVSYKNPYCFLSDRDSVDNFRYTFRGEGARRLTPQDSATVINPDIGLVFSIVCVDLCVEETPPSQCEFMFGNKFVRKDSWITSGLIEVIDTSGQGCTVGQCVCSGGMRMICDSPMRPGIGCQTPVNCPEYRAQGKSLKETKTLKTSQISSLNWLANAWTAWSNLLKLK